MVELTPEIVSVIGKNLSTEDESDDEDGDYFDSDECSSPCYHPLRMMMNVLGIYKTPEAFARK